MGDISEGLALESWFSVEEAERDIPELRRVRRQIRYLFGASFPSHFMGSDDSSDCGRSRQDVPTLPPVRHKADSNASDTRSGNDTWSSSGLSSFTSEAITEILPPKDKKERKHHRHRHYKQEERRSRSKKEEDLKPSNWAEVCKFGVWVLLFNRITFSFSTLTLIIIFSSLGNRQVC